MQHRRGEGTAHGPGSDAAPDDGLAVAPPTDWRVVADGDEAKHAVTEAADWALHLGRGSLQGRRDEWWVTVERDGKPVLDRERLVVGAGSSPWAAVAELLDGLR